jgi:hypothetical protein
MMDDDGSGTGKSGSGRGNSCYGTGKTKVSKK